MTEPTSFPVGRHYVAHERLGAGGMGTVYRGRSVDEGSTVAIKILHGELAEDPTFVARFVQERTILVQLRGQGVVRVLDLIVDRGMLAIVMELVPGGSLRQHLRRRGALPAAEAAAIATQVLRGLATVHGAGILHRDVKPANVLMEFRTDRPIAKLSDFGVSGLVDSGALTRMTGFVGTIDYMAPEVGMGAAATEGVDIYATGMMLYELVTGHTPFGGGHFAATLRRQMEEEPTRPPGIADGLWAAISSMISKRPETRPTAAEAALALERMARWTPDHPPGSRYGSDPTAGARTPDQGPTVVRSAGTAGLESSLRETPGDAAGDDVEPLTVLRSTGPVGSPSSTSPEIAAPVIGGGDDPDHGNGATPMPGTSDAASNVGDEALMTAAAGGSMAAGSTDAGPSHGQGSHDSGNEATRSKQQGRGEGHHRRRLAVTLVCFVAACSVAGLVIGLNIIAAGKGYYVGLSPDGRLAIYGGHRSGFLWVHPSIVKRYSFGSAQLSHITTVVHVTPSLGKTATHVDTFMVSAPSKSRVLLFTTLTAAERYVQRRHTSWQAKKRAAAKKAVKAAYDAKLAVVAQSAKTAMNDLEDANIQWNDIWGCTSTHNKCSSPNSALRGWSGMRSHLESGVIPSVEAASRAMTGVTITPGPAENVLNGLRSCIAAVLGMVQAADADAQKQATWPPAASARAMDAACSVSITELPFSLTKFPVFIESNWTSTPNG